MRIGDAAAAAYNPDSAGVAELVDATDLKSVGGNPVPVRFRPPAPASAAEPLRLGERGVAETPEPAPTA